MAQESKACDIGAGVDALVFCDDLRGIFVEPGHGIHQLLVLGLGEKPAPFRVGENAGADGLGEDQGVPGTDAVVPEDPVRMHEACHAETVFWNGVLDGVAAYHDGACFPHLVIAAQQDVVHILVGQALREHEHVHGQLCLAAHGPDVGKGVGGSDLAVFVGIVHCRREDVHGLDQGHLIGDLVNCGVVRRIISD